MKDADKILANGQLWWLARHIGAKIGLGNTRTSVQLKVSEENIYRTMHHFNGGNKNMIFLNLDGIHELCRGSKKPGAIALLNSIRSLPNKT